MGKTRSGLLDCLRGFTVLSMIFYHACWDLVNLLHYDLPFYNETAGYVWQQSICWVFILVAGFCFNLSHKHLARAMLLIVCGTLITLTTTLVTPDNAIIFGVLFFLGCAILVAGLCEKLLLKIPTVAGGILSTIGFVIFRNINSGWLGFEGLLFKQLPESLYHQGYLYSFIGFEDVNFHSTDYFSFLPWFFLFLVGYFLGRWQQEQHLELPAWQGKCSFLQFLGRHSLIVYLLHQPILFFIIFLCF
jgi:uncharacterized membrane protein